MSKHEGLENTVEGMLSDDPNERLVAEESQLKTRIEKLKAFISSVKDGTFEFKLKTPLSTLEEQLTRMEELEKILSERLAIEQAPDEEEDGKQ